MGILRKGGGIDFRFLQTLNLAPVSSPEVMVEHMRSALGRDLPFVRPCRAHGHVLSVAAGGPSLDDTYRSLTGYVGAVNGSLAWLLDRGIVPNACAVVDPGEHMVDVIKAHPSVSYFVASICHPRLFDKLASAGCHVVLWHPSGQVECEILLESLRPDDWLMVGGGCTMGLRWINLGYLCGFRTFKLHGLDSSFRGGATHAYPDRADVKEHININGRQTRLNFVNQVQDFFATLDTYDKMDIEPTDIEVYGEGLLQDELENRLCERGGLPWPRTRIRLHSPEDGVTASDTAA